MEEYKANIEDTYNNFMIFWGSLYFGQRHLSHVGDQGKLETLLLAEIYLKMISFCGIVT